MTEFVALIPAYNPDQTLVHVVRQLQASGMHCVVVNDGSSASCSHIFAQLPQSTFVIHQITNRGKGAALKRGMRFIEEQFGECVVVTADADGQHRPEDIRKTAEEALRCRDSLVLGVRMFDADNVPAKSLLGNRITEIIFRLFTGVHVSDTQTGLRAFHSSLIPSLLVLRPLTAFGMVGILSFVTDYLLFGLFSTLIDGPAGIVIANLSARLCSGTLNYEMNRRTVFLDSRPRSSSIVKYIALAALILLLNTGMLYGLTAVLGVNRWIAKIITETALFFLSWVIQSRYVFQMQKGEASL